VPIKSKCALILPGAVAKGAFEAGVIEVLAQKQTKIDRIVATSSGALNGVVYAMGIRSGHTKEMAARLVEAWIKGGGWHNSISFSPLDWLKGRGLSDNRGLLKMLQELVTPFNDSKKHEIELRVVVACLSGVESKIGNEPATTYERVFHFSGEDFDTKESLENIFQVTSAACAFPGLFAPVEIKGLGPCADGGAVNNAPIQYALDESDIDQVIIPVPFPALALATSPRHGIKLANHMIEILINERVFRDLKNAHAVNEDISKLEKLKTKGVINSQQLDAIQKSLEIRKVQITQIRPLQSVGENSFSGFFSKRDRTLLVSEGRKAALQALSQSDFKTVSPHHEKEKEIL
jgi:predicted acylesterase/phospholipase RssA